jgi:hypothetical protein
MILLELSMPTYVYTNIHVYSILIHKANGRGGELTREKVRGAIVHKAGKKYQGLTVSPFYKLY